MIMSLEPDETQNATQNKCRRNMDVFFVYNNKNHREMYQLVNFDIKFNYLL